jgi:hypothetical protein
MANRMVGALLAAMLACSYATAAFSEPLQVLYAEPFQPQSVRTPGTQKAGANVLLIRAFGGTFELEIEDNSSLLRLTSPQTRARLSATQLFRGTLRDVPGSWVRLTATNGVYSGAIWDGNELYAVEPREVLDDVLLTPLAGVAAGSAIYRLSDTRGGALQGVCALDTSAAAASSRPLEKYRSLVRELEASAASAPREIEVSMIADFEYTSREGAAVLDRMINHVNIVDGIFSGQVGVAIVPTDFITFAADTDQFSSSDASDLLDQLADYRQGTPAVRSRGLAHLLTGRPLDGNIIGIAFLGSLCDEHQGVSLSESSPFVDTPLIMAHEIGHNFGAPHDGQVGSACASTPSSFLMGPFLNNSSTFSACSLQQMQPVIAGAACVVPARNRDVSVTVPTSTILAPTDQTFTFVADVSSTGSTAAANVFVDVTIPQFFGLDRVSLASPGLNCAFTTQGVSCEAPELAAGETRRISVQLRSAVETQFTITADVSSTNDSNATNNTAATQVTVAIPRDFQITVAPQPITVVLGEPFEMTFDVKSIATRTLNDVRVELTHHGGITATAATIEGGTCTLTGSQPMAVCSLPTLAAGVTRRMRATMVSNSVGTTDTPGIRVFENGSTTGQQLTVFTVTTISARHLSITTSSAIGQRVAIGAEAVWAFDLRSTGVRAVDNVTVTFTWIGASDVDVSIDPPVGPGCTRSFFELKCNFGTLQPGETRPITLRGRVNVEGDLRIDIRAQGTGTDGQSGDHQLSVSIQARLGDDVQMSVSPPTSATLEGSDETVSAVITAAGVNASENVVMTATLPAGFVARSVFVFVDNLEECAIQKPAPNIAVCTLQRIPAGERRLINLRYTAGAAGMYTGTLSVAASTDADSSNNSAPITFTVSPNVDGTLLAPPEQILRTDVPVQLPFTIKSNKYTLPDARVDFSWSGLADVTITAPGASCANTSTGHSCSFGTLAPDTSIPFSMQMRATSPPWAFLQVRLVSPAETAPGNNGVFYTMRVYAPGDGAIAIPQPIPDITLGVRSNFVFDLNVSAEINDVLLELQFDPSRLAQPFMGSNCQTTMTGMLCDFGSTQLPQSKRLAMSFLPNALGPTPVSVRVMSINDANSANDMQTATLTIVAPPPPPPPPAPPTSPPATSSGGGGSGGGGPMSWLLALALALLVVARVRPAARAHHSSWVSNFLGATRT